MAIRYGVPSSGFPSGGPSRALRVPTPDAPPATPTDETSLDNFNRSNGAVYAGTGSTLWSTQRLNGDPTDAIISSNALASSTATFPQAVSLFRLQADFDLVGDVAVVPGTPNFSFGIWFNLQNAPGGTINGYTVYGDTTGFWALRRVDAGSNTVLTSTGAGPSLAAGSSIWIKRLGTNITVYYKTSAGSYGQVLTWSDGAWGSGYMAIEMSDTTVRWDNLRGGPLAAGPTSYPRTADDSWSISDAAVPAPATRVRTVTDTITVSDSAAGVIGAPPGAYYAEVVADTPFRYWRLGSATATDNEEIGGVDDMTFPSSSVPAKVAGALTGDSNGAVQFPGGSGSYGYVPVTLSNTSGTPMTVEAWVWWDAYNSSDDNMLMEYFPAWFNFAGSFSVDMNNSAGGAEASTVSIGFRIGSSLFRHTFPQSALPAAGWHHFVFVMTPSTGVSAANQIKVYVDGAAVTTTVRDTGTTTGTWASSDQDLYIMARHTTLLNGAGRMDELAIYKYELSAARVLVHYNAGIGGGGPTTYPRTAADSWSVSDVVARAPGAQVRTIADSVALSDAAARAPAAYLRPAADTVALSDAAVRAPAARVRPAADSVALSDAAVRAAGTRPRAVPDTIALTDSALRASGARVRTVSDSVTSLADVAVPGPFGRPRPVADTIALSDVAAEITSVAKLAADTVVLSDVAVRAPAARARAVPDSIALSDAAVRAASARIRAAADSWTATDSAQRASSAQARALADVVVLSDVAAEITGVGKGAADTIALSDVATQVRVQLRTASDTLGLSDTAVRAAAARARGASDALTVSDSALRGVVGLGRPAADVLIVSDVAQRAPTPRARVAADSFGLADVVARVVVEARAVPDAILISDAAVLAPTPRARVATDVVDLADLAVRAPAVRVRPAADSVVLSDVAALTPTTRVRPVPDSWAVSDVVQRAPATFGRTAIDVWAISDSLTGLDTAAPTVTVTSGDGQRLSDESGKDSYFYAFQATEACQAYEILVVPAPDSTRAAGTLVESGGAISANTTINGSVTFTELQAAGQTGTEGEKILKFFARDVAGNWST